MPNVSLKLAGLPAKIQDRLNRVGLQANQTSAAVETVESRHKALTNFVNRLRDDVVAVRDYIEEVRTENDKREERQTLRDQSNVQSLVNLRESVQKGFDLVRNDVDTLNKKDRTLSDRITEIETFQKDLVERAKRLVVYTRDYQAPAPSMPSDHVWVNKKLTGVYDSMTELEVRMRKLEERAKDAEDIDKAFKFVEPANPAPVTAECGGLLQGVTYQGFNVRFKGSKLILESRDDVEVFYLPSQYGGIVCVRELSWGLQISLKNGNQYVLVGGPRLVDMWFSVFVKVS